MGETIKVKRSTYTNKVNSGSDRFKLNSVFLTCQAEGL